MIRVRTPCRLHFGLLNLGNETFWPGIEEVSAIPSRKFGGVGLMVTHPGLVIELRPARTWTAEGPLASRALGFVKLLSQSGPTSAVRPHHIRIVRAAPEHMGLGTGTQLGLALAKGLSISSSLPEVAVEDLSQVVGRGKRSGLGIHGFAHGGFLVDGGKCAADRFAPLVCRLDFPDDWRIVLVMPPGQAGIHGDCETQAFARLQSASSPNASPEALCRIVLLGMLPALREHDLESFGEAVFEFNARVGEVFAPVQGGRYGDARAAEIVSFVRGRGIRGVGQSSWGPGLFALVDNETEAKELAAAVRDRFQFERPDVLVTAADNAGASIQNLSN